MNLPLLPPLVLLLSAPLHAELRIIVFGAHPDAAAPAARAKRPSP